MDTTMITTWKRIKAEEKAELVAAERKAKQMAKAGDAERKLYEKLKKKFEKTGQA